MKKLFVIPFLLIALSACSDNGNNKSVRESGNIESTDVILSAQTSGKILKLIYDEGSQVKQGDTLMIIDHEMYDLQLRQALAAADIAKAQLDLLVKGSRKEDIEQAKEMFNQAQANLTIAETDKGRMDNLYASNSVTKKQYDDTMLRYEVAKSQFNAAKENLTKMEHIARPEEIAQAKANLEKAGAAADMLKKNVRDCFIVSPINGIVVKRFMEPGETASVMSSLLKVSDLSRVEVVIYVNETDLPRIKLNQTAEVTADGQPGKVYEGKVIFISPEAEFTPKNIQTKEERTKQVFAVKLEIENKTGDLKTGLPVDVKINL